MELKNESGLEGPDFQQIYPRLAMCRQDSISQGKPRVRMPDMAKDLDAGAFLAINEDRWRYRNENKEKDVLCSIQETLYLRIGRAER